MALPRNSQCLHVDIHLSRIVWTKRVQNTLSKHGVLRLQKSREAGMLFDLLSSFAPAAGGKTIPCFTFVSHNALIAKKSSSLPPEERTITQEPGKGAEQNSLVIPPLSVYHH
jgi:hypothetical protein